MRRTIVFETKEVPEEIVDLLAVNILEMKELKRFMFDRIRKEIEEKGVKGAVEEIWRTAYGDRWKEKVDDKAALLERILMLSQVRSEKAQVGEEVAQVEERRAEVVESRKEERGSEGKESNRELLNRLKALK